MMRGDNLWIRWPFAEGIKNKPTLSTLQPRSQFLTALCEQHFRTIASDNQVIVEEYPETASNRFRSREVLVPRCQQVVRYLVPETGVMTAESREIDEEGSRSAAESPIAPAQWLLDLARARTPARILMGRAGAAYRTETWLKLRGDHAFAKDAVLAEVDLARDFGDAFVARWEIFQVATLAETRNDYLLRPDLGRSLSANAIAELRKRCPPGVEFQVAIADGLSATAVRTQVPSLLPLLRARAELRGWRFGQPFLLQNARVGVLNDIGETLNAAVVVLLIGERPGLATAESLSAYMAFMPKAGHDDSQRNLISNIHARGVSSEVAAERIARLAELMMTRRASGVLVKEEVVPPALPTAEKRPIPPTVHSDEKALRADSSVS
jgi:ethanolamine ammonia-lyase small subunit